MASSRPTSFDGIEQSMKPFPHLAVFILLACNLTEPIVMAVLFPIAPVMVASWVPEDEVGSWVGLLTSMFQITGVPGSLFWGWLSDKIGRRPCILCILVGSALSLTAFGASTSLETAMLWRLVGGCFSGIGGVVLAAMRDLTQHSDDHRTRAVSAISFAYGFGYAVGPLIGGLGSSAADRIPALRGTIFETHPFLLPTLIVTLLILASGIGLIWLPAANDAASASSGDGVSPGHATGVRGPDGKPGSIDHTPSTSTSKGHPQVVEGAEGQDDTPRLLPPGSTSSSMPSTSAMEDPRSSIAMSPDAPRLARPPRPSAAMRRRLERCTDAACSPLMQLMYAHFLLNLAILGAMECFPLLLLRPASAGGLGLRPWEVGLTFLPQAATVLTIPLLVYHRLARRCGHSGAFLVGAGALSVFDVGLPSLLALSDAGATASSLDRVLPPSPPSFRTDPVATILIAANSTSNTSARTIGALNISVPAGSAVGVSTGHASPYVLVGACLMASTRGATGPLLYPALSIILSKAIPGMGRAGYWNGLAQAWGMAARAVAPWLFGHLFALGTARGHAPFPFNVHMPFLVNLVAIASVALLVARMEGQDRKALRWRCTRLRRCFSSH